MQRRIYKYPFTGDLLQVLEGKVVLVAQDLPTDTYPTVWIEHSAGETQSQQLTIHGTGHIIPHQGVHIGSCKCTHFIWHVYRIY